MVESKTIGISALITVGMILAVAITPNFFQKPKYYCEAESSIMNCPGGLSGGSATRCYLNEEKTSWDYCSSGWMQVTDDRPIQEEPEIKEIKKETESPEAEPAAKYICPPNDVGCYRV